MAKKVFTYHGKNLEELKKLSLKEFAQLVDSRTRRTLLRGVPEEHKKVIEKIKKSSKRIKTHCRDMIIVPEMVNQTILIHNGKEFVAVIIQPEMLGHRLGEFALTRKNLAHSAPGVGATRSSASASVK